MLLLNNNRGRYCLRCTLFGCSGFHGELDATAIIGLENLDANDLAFFDVVLDLIDAFLSDLGDMQQTVLARKYGNDCAEIKNFQYGAFVDLANFDFCGDGINPSPGGSSGFTTGCCDGDRAVVLDIDRGARFFGQRTNDSCLLYTSDAADE